MDNTLLQINYCSLNTWILLFGRFFNPKYIALHSFPGNWTMVLLVPCSAVWATGRLNSLTMHFSLHDYTEDDSYRWTVWDAWKIDFTMTIFNTSMFFSFFYLYRSIEWRSAWGKTLKTSCLYSIKLTIC